MITYHIMGGFFRNRGFTLVELLVVIAIIALLSSIVLAAVNSARDKGKDSAIKSDLDGLRTTAVLQYEILNNSYNSTGLNVLDTTCSGAANANTLLANTSIQNSISHANSQDGKTVDVVCVISEANYAVAAPTKTGANSVYWCVDYTGISQQIDIGTLGNVINTDTSCAALNAR